MCSCNSCRSEDFSNCERAGCGCEKEYTDAVCVRQTTNDLPCIGSLKGDTLDNILFKINGKLCDLRTPSYIRVSKEPPGANCTAGGTKIEVIDKETNVILSYSYVCNIAQNSILELKQVITANEIKTAATQPIVLLPAPGVGKAISVIASSYKFVVEDQTTPTAFTSNLVGVESPGAVVQQLSAPNVLNRTTDIMANFLPPLYSSTQFTTLIENAALQFRTNQNSLVGNGRLILWVTYKIIDTTI